MIFTIVLYCVFGSIAFFTLLGLFSLFLILKKDKYGCKLGMKFVWCYYAIFMVLGFIIVIIFLPISIFWNEGCEIYHDFLTIE